MSSRCIANKEAADAASYRQHIPMMAYFGGSVAGLAAGAPVVLRGIRIGEVTAASHCNTIAKTDNVVVPVRFDVEPERIEDWPAQPTSDLPATLRELVAARAARAAGERQPDHRAEAAAISICSRTARRRSCM